MGPEKNMQMLVRTINVHPCSTKIKENQEQCISMWLPQDRAQVHDPDPILQKKRLIHMRVERRKDYFFPPLSMSMDLKKSLVQPTV